MRAVTPRSRLRRDDFFRQSSGSVTMLFGVAAIVLVAAVGLAVDISRYYNMSAKIQDSIDAAALTGAKLLPKAELSNDDISSIVKKNYNVAMTSAGVETAQVAPLSVTIDRNQSSVSVVSKVKVRSLFGPILGQPRLTLISRDTRVIYQMNKIELAMVLDITGSMNAKNKLADLKAAASDVIDELMNASISENSIRIALAPYSASVNAGQLADSVSATPPKETCSTSWFKGLGCKTSAGVDLDTCVIERNGANAATDAAPMGIDKIPTVQSLPYGNYVCPKSTVVPLSGKSQAATLKSLINSYVATGATAGHIGTAWGWYLLSPNWSSTLGADGEPAAYADKSVTKSMIVMTDGLFNTSYVNGPSSSATDQSNESYSRFQALCSNAKAKGVTIYAVGFDLADARAIAELKGCANGDANFYDAKTGAQLKDAFKSIAAKLNTLRVAS